MLSPDEILQRVREQVHHPASVRELMQALRVPREERAAFRRRLKTLAASGLLVQVRGHLYGLPDKLDLVVGRLETHAGGFGFVAPEGGGAGQGDIYIAPANLKEAMHGDRVVARIERYREDERAEGRIIRVLERGHPTIVGRYQPTEEGIAFLVPFDQRIATDILVPAAERAGAKAGEMVTVEIVRWPTATRGAVGRVIEVIGDVNDPGVDTKVIIRKHGLPDEHGAEALAEAQRTVGGAGPARTVDARPQDIAGRTDFRALQTVTIDGEHARDFDDAISIERLPDRHYRLGVHIADVSHYVREGSALDEEAYERGTSVYFPERALHMFPEALATGLCSLNPHVDRLVQSCVMEVDRQGNVVGYEFHDGVIRTAERMTYTDVNAILTEGDGEARTRYEPLVPMFERMRELFQILNERRRRLGSIDFDLEEAELVLDEAGLVEAVIPSERNIAHRIVEEFMLLANETVAAYLDAHAVPSLYRVHEDPDPLKVAKFEEFVSSFGHTLGAPLEHARPRHFQKLLVRLQGRPEEKAVAYLMLRTMQKARYTPQNLGHFGLAFSSYTHFTSPIRRYPDLVVHRVLRAARRGPLPEARRDQLIEELPEVARHTSERERLADEAERELVQWKKVRFMADKVGDEFEGYVTGVAPFGLFVELLEHFVEGLVHVSTMADDYYRFDEVAHALVGENTGKVYRLADRARVQILRVDLEQRRIELGIVEILDQVRQDDRRERPRRITARRETHEAGKAPAGRRWPRRTGGAPVRRPTLGPRRRKR